MLIRFKDRTINLDTVQVIQPDFKNNEETYFGTGDGGYVAEMGYEKFWLDYALAMDKNWISETHKPYMLILGEVSSRRVPWNL